MLLLGRWKMCVGKGASLERGVRNSSPGHRDPEGSSSPRGVGLKPSLSPGGLSGSTLKPKAVSAVVKFGFLSSSSPKRGRSPTVCPRPIATSPMGGFAERAGPAGCPSRGLRGHQVTVTVAVMGLGSSQAYPECFLGISTSVSCAL